METPQPLEQKAFPEEQHDPVPFLVVTLTPPTRPPRAGDLCPKCQRERLDYDGLLNLACPICGVVEGGCFT